jgi:chemotaxis-related protein WspD
MSSPLLANYDDCWRRIGVAGDLSCPELVAHVHCRNCPRFGAAAAQFFDRPVQLASAPTFAPPANPPRDQLRLFVFWVAGHPFVLDYRWLVEIAPVANARRIAHRSGRLLQGLVNVRGELLLCIALERLLGLASLEPDASAVSRALPRLVILRGPRGTWSFVASQVQGIEYVDPDSIEAAPVALPRPMDTLVSGLAVLPAPAGLRASLLDGEQLMAAFDAAVY